MKNQSHPIVIVKSASIRGMGNAHGSENCLRRFYDRNDGLLVMWLISISSPKELIQIAEYFRTPLATAVSGGPRILTVTARFSAAAMITPRSRVREKELNIDELKRKDGAGAFEETARRSRSTGLKRTRNSRAATASEDRSGAGRAAYPDY